MTFRTVTSGSEPREYRWTRNGEIIPGNTPELRLQNVQAANAGAYRVTVSNATPRSAARAAPPSTLTENLISRVYDPSGPKTYTYVYDDENRRVEMRIDTYYTPEGSRWPSTWDYDGLSRVRRRNDFTWYPGNPGGFYNSGETRFLYDGRRVIQERNSCNIPTVTHTRGPDLSMQSHRLRLRAGWERVRRPVVSANPK